MSTELNLLPPDRRQILTQRLIWELLGRSLTSLAIGLAVITGVGVVLIGGLQLLAWTTARGTPAEFEQALARYQELRDVIAEQNVALNEMSALSSQRIVWSQLVPTILATFPPGIVVRTMTAEAASRRFTFGGVAATRSTLIVLAERLKVLPWVDELTAPLSNLVQRDNPPFQFNLMVKASPGPGGSPAPSPTAAP